MTSVQEYNYQILAERNWLSAFRLILIFAYLGIALLFRSLTGSPENLSGIIGLVALILLLNFLFNTFSYYFKHKGALEQYLFLTLMVDIAMACVYVEFIGRNQVILSLVLFSFIISSARTIFHQNRGLQISFLCMASYGLLILTNRIGWWGAANQQLISQDMDFQYFFLHVIAFFVTALITLPRSFFEALLFQGSDIRYMKQKHLEMRLTHKTKLLAESYAFENVTKDANDFLSYLKLVMNSFLRTLNANVGSVLIYNEEVQLLELKVYCDLKNEKNEPPPYLLKLGEEISGLSAESKQPLILLDTFKQPPAQAIQYENYLQGTVVSLPLMTGGRLLGVVNIVKKTGFFQKGNPLSDTDLDNLKLLEMEITRALMNFHLKQELEGIAFSTVKALVKALEAKDPYTKHHSENVAWYSIVIAREMNLSQTEMRDILFSCQLHDLGKIGINDEILMKKGPLNPQEWEIMKTHPTLGEEMLKPIKSLRNVALIIGQEHERYDGKGYPRALKGAEVLLTAQIVSVADAFDVITSKRSYKEAQSVEFALAEISRCSGTQFHPRVVQALLDAVNKNYSVIMEFLANRDVEGYVEGKIQEFLERSRIYL